MHDVHFITDTVLSFQKSDINPDFLARIRTGIDKVRPEEKGDELCATFTSD